MPPADATKRAALIRACALAAHPRPGGCAWCGADLPARRRVWCSDRCDRAFWANHWFSVARAAAKRRDRYACVRCGERAPKRPTRRGFAREVEYRAAMRAYRALRRTHRLEVNHRIPAAGTHRTLSCAHHLENLETLCGACHAHHTAALRVERRVARAASAPARATAAPRERTPA